MHSYKVKDLAQKLQSSRAYVVVALSSWLPKPNLEGPSFVESFWMARELSSNRAMEIDLGNAPMSKSIISRDVVSSVLDNRK
jgi:hypothetical protein